MFSLCCCFIILSSPDPKLNQLFRKKKVLQLRVISRASLSMLIQLQPGWVFVRLWPSFELSSPIQASLRILFVRKSKHDLWFEMVLIICSLSYVATDAVLSWKWKLFPYDTICLLKWKLKRWIVKRGRTIKKKKVTLPPLNSSHSASQNFCCWGTVAWRPEKGCLLQVILQINCCFISLVSSAPLLAFGVLWDIPWAHLLSVHFVVSLGHILSLQLQACSRTVGKKTGIASWRKYHTLKKIVAKFLARKQVFRRFSSVVFGKQCWHGAREHAVPGLWCVLCFPQGRAMLGSVLGQANHIRCCSAVLPGLQPAGSICLWFTGRE